MTVSRSSSAICLLALVLAPGSPSNVHERKPNQDHMR